MHTTRSLLATLVTFTILASSSLVWAQVRSSSNYQIERDSINIGGGLSNSVNYSLETTVGETATGRGTSTNYLLDAGFQQQPEVTLTLTSAGAVTMDTAIGGVTGGLSSGSTSVVATTDGAAGYQLTIQASQSPAMQSISGATISDYPVGGTADLAFTVGPGEAYFGFSPFGDDVVGRYRTNGSVCGSGSPSTTVCWDGLSTSPTTIASKSGANFPTGATTTLYFKVGIGSNVMQPPGVYTATTTITLVSL